VSGGPSTGEAKDNRTGDARGNFEDVKRDRESMQVTVDKSDSKNCKYGSKKLSVTNISREEYARRTRTDEVSNMLLRFRMNTSKTDEASHLRNGVYSVDGDGVIPTISSGFMPVKGWRSFSHLNPSNIKVVAREYFHRPYTVSSLAALKFSPADASHCGIMGNHEMIWDILSIVSETPISTEEKEAVELSVSESISINGALDEELVSSSRPPLAEYTYSGLPVKERFYSDIREMSARVPIPTYLVPTQE
jgi:hypothetical protein